MTPTSYKTWEFEILDNFYGYGSLPEFDKVIQRMRLISVSEPTILINKTDILIDIISMNHPNGHILLFENGEKTISESMIGISILKPDKHFDIAYVSDHIFIYPNLLTCRIIQESLRVAKKVYIYRTNDAIRFPWQEEKILLPKVQKQHFYYEVNDLFAFLFKSVNEYIEVTYLPQIIK